MADYNLATQGKIYIIGSTTGCSNFANALVTIGSTVATLIVPSGNHVGDGQTVPATMTLQIERGGIFTVSNGATFTINGTIKAGPYQIFNCNTTGFVQFAATGHTPGTGCTINPRWFGAVGNNSTVDTNAMNQALASWRATAGGVMEGNPGDAYLVGPLTIPINTNLFAYGQNFDWDGKGCYIVQNNNTGDVLTSEYGLHSLHNMSIVTPKIISGTTPDRVGTGFKTDSYAVLRDSQVHGFNKAIVLQPGLYCNFEHLRLWSNNYCISIEYSIVSDSNYNCFKDIYCGSFQTCAIYIEHCAGNHFDHIDFEGNVGQYIHLKDTVDTEFRNLYSEGGPTGTGVAEAILLDNADTASFVGGQISPDGDTNTSLLSVFHLINSSFSYVSRMRIYVGSAVTYLYKTDGTTDNRITFDRCYIATVRITQDAIPSAKFIDCIFPGNTAFTTDPSNVMKRGTSSSVESYCTNAGYESAFGSNDGIHCTNTRDTTFAWEGTYSWKIACDTIDGTQQARQFQLVGGPTSATTYWRTIQFYVKTDTAQSIYILTGYDASAPVVLSNDGKWRLCSVLDHPTYDTTGDTFWGIKPGAVGNIWVDKLDVRYFTSQKEASYYMGCTY